MSKRYTAALIAAAILYIVIGLILMIWPEEARLILCWTLGAALILYGAYRVIAYFNNASDAPVQFGAAIGVACVTAGALLLVKAGAVVAVFASVAGAALVIDSILRIQLALDIRRLGGRHWGPMAICGGLMLAVGVMLVLNPFEAVRTATIVAGAALVADGILTLWCLIETAGLLKERSRAAEHPRVR